MIATDDFIKATVDIFCETVTLKLKQFRNLIPKNHNSELTGNYVEAIVKSIISEWIHPFAYYTGTMYPYDACPKDLAKDLPILEGLHKPKQIDGIVFDPSLGPATIKEGDFIIAHPAFCRGIIEVKTSEPRLKDFYIRLQQLYAQYFHPYESTHSQVMGIVIHSENPEKDSILSGIHQPLYSHSHINHCPVFILFDQEYEAHRPAIESLVHALFTGSIRSMYRPPMRQS